MPMSSLSKTVVDEERILSQAGDAETESEDKSSYYHRSIKTSEAETRLKSHGEGSYLFRESGIKNRIFVLSTFSNGHICRIQVPNSEGKNMINSSASCQNPVPSLIIKLVLI